MGCDELEITSGCLLVSHLDLDESDMEQYYLTIYNKLIQDGEAIDWN